MLKREILNGRKHFPQFSGVSFHVSHLYQTSVTLHQVIPLSSKKFLLKIEDYNDGPVLIIWDLLLYWNKKDNMLQSCAAKQNGLNNFGRGPLKIPLYEMILSKVNFFRRSTKMSFNTFAHSTNLQQTTLETSRQKHGKSL